MSTWRGMVLARVSIATLNMALLSSLRTALYPHLAVIANEWNACMNIDRRYPAQHADFLKECHDGGQTRPHRCCCNMSRATSTTCTRTSTAILPFRSR